MWRVIVAPIGDSLDGTRVAGDDGSRARLGFVLTVHAVEEIGEKEEVAIKVDDVVCTLLEPPTVAPLDVHVDMALIGAAFLPRTVVDVRKIRGLWQPALVIAVVHKEDVEPPLWLASLKISPLLTPLMEHTEPDSGSETWFRRAKIGIVIVAWSSVSITLSLANKALGRCHSHRTVTNTHVTFPTVDLHRVSRGISIPGVDDDGVLLTLTLCSASMAGVFDDAQFRCQSMCRSAPRVVARYT